MNLFEANGFFQRLKGLHAYLPLQNNEALVIKACNAIHTMSMKSRIDVMFVNKEGCVIKALTVPPYRFVRCSKACSVIEMCSGTIEKIGIEVGDTLEREHGRWE